MGISSQKGAFGFMPQTAKGSERISVGDFEFCRVLMVPQLGVRGATRLPPEVGGSRGSAGSIVNGIAVGDEMSMLVRPNSFGYLLKGLAGSVATATDSPVASTYTHTFTPSETKNWFTVLRRVGSIFAERYKDCLVAGMTFDFVPGQPLTATVGIMGREVTQIAAPADATLHWDSSEVLSVVGANSSVMLDTGSGLAAVDVQRARVTISNGLTPDGFIIGSMFQPDFTMTDLILGITLDVVINDATLYQKIYYGGAITGAMVDDVLVGQIQLKAASAGYITGTTPYSLEIDSDGSSMEFMMLPVALRGQDLVVAQLSGQIKLIADGAVWDSYKMLLVNSVPAY